MNYIGQSAIEYLMTYGWMLLVIAIAGGAIFSIVQDQNIEGVTGFNSKDVSIDDFGVSNSEGLMFSIASPVRRIGVQKIRLTDSSSKNVTYSIDEELSGDSMVSLPGIMPSSENNELDVELIYNTGNLENLTVSGSVEGTLDIGNGFSNKTIILNSLKGYWPLNPAYTGETQALDVSGNKNHGLLNGADFTESSGLENALKFNGDSFVEIEHGQTFENFEEVTMFAVAELEGRTGNWQGILTKNNHPNSIIIEDDNRGVVGSVNINSDRQYTGTNMPIDELVGETFSVAHTYDTNTGEALVYINGAVEADENKDVGEVTWGSANIYIGNRRDGGRPWNGSIKDVMIFDRALPQEEIQTLHNNTGIVRE